MVITTMFQGSSRSDWSTTGAVIQQETTRLPGFAEKSVPARSGISVRFLENSNQFLRRPGEILVPGICDVHLSPACFRICKIKCRRPKQRAVPQAALGYK